MMSTGFESQRRKPLVAQPPSLPEVAYAYLREEILSHRVAFGEPLRQEQIAADLGMSRLPVREALMRLEAEGLLNLRPRRGYVVSSLDRQEIEELFDARAVLEQRAGFLATQQRTDTDIAAVTGIFDQLDVIVRQRPADIAAFAATNRAFHDRLFAASGRKLLGRLMATLRDNLERYIRLSASLAGHLDDAHAEHRAIVAAFSKGDAAMVGDLSRDHCDATCRRLVANLGDHFNR